MSGGCRFGYLAILPFWLRPVSLSAPFALWFDVCGCPSGRNHANNFDPANSSGTSMGTNPCLHNADLRTSDTRREKLFNKSIICHQINYLLYWFILNIFFFSKHGNGTNGKYFINDWKIFNFIFSVDGTTKKAPLTHFLLFRPAAGVRGFEKSEEIFEKFEVLKAAPEPKET